VCFQIQFVHSTLRHLLDSVDIYNPPPYTRDFKEYKFRAFVIADMFCVCRRLLVKCEMLHWNIYREAWVALIEYDIMQMWINKFTVLNLQTIKERFASRKVTKIKIEFYILCCVILIYTPCLYLIPRSVNHVCFIWLFLGLLKGWL